MSDRGPSSSGTHLRHRTARRTESCGVYLYSVSGTPSENRGAIEEPIYIPDSFSSPCELSSPAVLATSGHAAAAVRGAVGFSLHRRKKCYKRDMDLQVLPIISCPWSVRLPLKRDEALGPKRTETRRCSSVTLVVLARNQVRVSWHVCFHSLFLFESNFCLSTPT